MLLAYSRVGLGWLMALLRFPPADLAPPILGLSTISESQALDEAVPQSSTASERRTVRSQAPSRARLLAHSPLTEKRMTPSKMRKTSRIRNHKCSTPSTLMRYRKSSRTTVTATCSRT